MSQKTLLIWLRRSPAKWFNHKGTSKATFIFWDKNNPSGFHHRAIYLALSSRGVFWGLEFRNLLHLLFKPRSPSQNPNNALLILSKLTNYNKKKKSQSLNLLSLNLILFEPGTHINHELNKTIVKRVNKSRRVRRREGG